MKLVWTNYPFDKPGEEVASQEVAFLSWDGNKYATVRLSDRREIDIKIGYLFLDQELQQPFQPGHVSSVQ